jgi:hypothetical protein
LGPGCFPGQGGWGGGGGVEHACVFKMRVC